MLWATIFKQPFAGNEVAELGVHNSLMGFNEGPIKLLKIPDIIGYPVGFGSCKNAIRKDETWMAEKVTQREDRQECIDSGILLHDPGMSD